MLIWILGENLIWFDFFTFRIFSMKYLFSVWIRPHDDWWWYFYIPKLFLSYKVQSLAVVFSPPLLCALPLKYVMIIMLWIVVEGHCGIGTWCNYGMRVKGKYFQCFPLCIRIAVLVLRQFWPTKHFAWFSF